MFLQKNSVAVISMEFFPSICGWLLTWCILTEFKIAFSNQSSYIDKNSMCMSVNFDANFRISGQMHYPVNIYLFKFSNRYTKKRYEICSKLRVKTPNRRHWRLWTNFLHLFLGFLLLTLSLCLFAGYVQNLFNSRRKYY